MSNVMLTGSCTDHGLNERLVRNVTGPAAAPNPCVTGTEGAVAKSDAARRNAQPKGPRELDLDHLSCANCLSPLQREL
eukprot:923620-Rhodomonas_salina.1